MPSERRSSRSIDRQGGNRATIQGVISTEHRAETDRRDAEWRERRPTPFRLQRSHGE